MQQHHAAAARRHRRKARWVKLLVCAAVVGLVVVPLSQQVLHIPALKEPLLAWTKVMVLQYQLHTFEPFVHMPQGQLIYGATYALLIMGLYGAMALLLWVASAVAKAMPDA
ncbi:MAG: hypothetical protein WAX89_08050 [Alphaproteobacteria bacterium]